MENIIPITYPEEFRITALVTRMNIHEMLQLFVDEVSFYAFCGGYRKKPFTRKVSLTDSKGDTHKCVVKIKQLSWQDEKAEYIVGIIANCMVSHKLKFYKEKDSELRRLLIKFLGQFYSLISDFSISHAEKVRWAKLHLKDWEEKQAPLLTLPKQAILEQGESIDLPFEFSMVCRICNLSAQQVLHYFMSKFSIARIKAEMQFVEDNPGIGNAASPFGGSSFFSSTKEVNDSDAERDIRNAYEQKFIVVHASLKREKDAGKRRDTYLAFYRSWYDELIAIS